MILHVLKLPNSRDVATCQEAADGTPPPPGWEAMTRAEFEAWRAPFIPVYDDGQPTFNPATEKIVDDGIIVEPTRRRRNWLKVALTQEELDANADKAERLAIKAMIADLTADHAEADADQAKAQTYIDIASPTAAERNAEIFDAAKREKRAAKREQRLIRMLKYVAKHL